MNHIVTYIFEVCEFTYLYDVEIKVSLLGISLNDEVGVDLELADNDVIDEQSAGIVHRE